MIALNKSTFLSLSLDFFPKPLIICSLRRKIMPNVPAKKKSTRAYKPPENEDQMPGRKPRDFDKNIFENLCHIDCTVDEIRAVLKADYNTIDNWCMRTYNFDFPTAYKEFRLVGNASFRRDQTRLAKTNASVNIWVGKTRLKQQEPIHEMIENGDLARLLASNETLMNQITKAQEAAKLQSALKAANSASNTDSISSLETG